MKLPPYPRWAWVVAGAIVLAVAARLFLGRAPHQPAVVTTNMNVHEAVSRSLDARVARLIHDRVTTRPSDEKLVALTFDDGPFPVQTPLLLDTLADLHVPATFFLIGQDARTCPELAARIAREGHEVGNHTLTHPAAFEKLEPKEVVDELNGAAGVLYPLTHDPAVRSLMRPPHGRMSEAGILAAQRAGFNVIFWNEDPADERSDDAAAIAQRVEAHATQPDIVLLHSGSMSTIAMLPEIVDRFRRAGYRFVTVGELLTLEPPSAIIHPVRQAI